MLGQRRRWWANIETTLVQRLVSAASLIVCMLVVDYYTALLSSVLVRHAVKAIYSHNILGFNITFEAIVWPIITLGARWVVEKIAKHE